MGTLDRVTQKVLVGTRESTWPSIGTFPTKESGSRAAEERTTRTRVSCAGPAFDRLLALCDKGLLSGAPREEFLRERERIRQEIETRAWNEKIQSYASTLDGEGMDATLLRIPWYGFERADSKRMKLTYRRVCEQLGSGDGLAVSIST